MPIDCPAAQQSVTVTVNGAGQGTICVRGTVITTSMGQVSIQVMVFDGTQNDFPTTPPSGTVAATFDGQNWCASGVPVPPLGMAGQAMPGAPLTAVAWQIAGGSVERMMIQPFFGVDASVSGGVDCCVGCGSGSGTTFLLISELAAGPDLEVTIPDGPHAGLHRATSPDPATWTWHMKVRRTRYTISADPSGRLLARRANFKALSVSMAGNPFSATFPPGKVFQAAGDVVVTVA